MPQLHALPLKFGRVKRRSPFQNRLSVRIAGFFSFAFFVLAAAQPAFSQTGRLSGTVRDQKQGALAGAKVTVRNVGNQVVDTQVTKSDGTYLFPSLAPGTYDVETQAPNFKLLTTRGVRVAIGDNPSLDITLVLESVATKITVEGSADNGYKTESATNIGPFANANIQDTPYSITVVPHELLQNLQPSSAEQVFEMIPGLQVSLPQGIGDGIRINSRGFWTDTGEDGFRYVDYNIGPIAIEDKESVELMSGLSGFLYGPRDPGGFANYVLKRPTDTRFESVTLGDYGGASGYIHLDLGGPIDKNDRFGYRINIVGQGLGDTAIQDQKIERALFSAAFDWHISHRALLQLDAEWHDYRLEGQTAVWLLGNYIYSPAPNASKDWGDPFSFAKYESTHTGVDFKYDFTDKLSLRAAYRFMWYRDDFIFVGNEPNTVNDGTYAQFINHTEDFTTTSQDSRILMDYNFHTGPVSHDLTFGFMSWRSSALAPENDRVILDEQPGFSLNNPAGNPAASNAIQAQLGAMPIVLGPMQNVGTDYSYSRMIGDQITFSPSWMAIAGINYAGVLEQNYPTGTPGAKYDRNAWTPTASLIYKPVSSVSTYFTYMQGLEQGGFASTSNNGFPVTNPGNAPPTIDTEYEAGVKASIGKAQLNAAFFDVTQANDQFILNSAGNSYTFDSSGRESHKGVEIDLTGKVLPGLSLFGGVTLLDPKIVADPENPSFVGVQPINVSRYFGKLYAEYEIPGVRGLVVTGGFQSYSQAPIAEPNQVYTPAYTVGNLGARYTTHLLDHDTIFRINAANLTNKNYWISSEAEGDPRSVSFSMQVVF